MPRPPTLSFLRPSPLSSTPHRMRTVGRGSAPAASHGDEATRSGEKVLPSVSSWLAPRGHPEGLPRCPSGSSARVLLARSPFSSSVARHHLPILGEPRACTKQANRAGRRDG